MEGYCGERLQVNTGDKGPDFFPDRTSESSVAAAEMVNYCPLDSQPIGSFAFIQLC